MEQQLQAIATVLSLVNPMICAAMFASIEAGQARAARLADATKAALAVLAILVVAALVSAPSFGVSWAGPELPRIMAWSDSEKAVEELKTVRVWSLVKRKASTDPSIRSWLDDLACSVPDVRTRSVEAFNRMTERAESVLEALVSELQRLQLNPSDKLPALWAGFGKIVTTSPSVVCGFLHSRQEIVDWLTSAPPEFLRVMREHENNEIKELYKTVYEADVRRIFRVD